MMSLSVSVGNSWNSKPVGGARFEMIFPSPRAVGVADLGAVVAFLVSSGSMRAAPLPDGG